MKAPFKLSNNILRFNISANDCQKHNYGTIHIGTSGFAITNIKVYNKVWRNEIPNYRGMVEQKWDRFIDEQ
ncbi:MAG: hypothetical protein M3512_14825 [Bacteroidota bacterium]|nr:hypothetical protein [Bacteroidota bacterium]MDQ3534322.1 hypothetical protein [Bacteroidota bacterium]